MFLFSSAVAQNPVCLFQPTNSPIYFWTLNTDTGDFNNDAIVDFLSPNNGGFDLRLSNGWGTYLAPTNFTFNSYYTRVKSADFNNDNNNDVIGIPPADSNFIIIWRGNGAGSFTSVTTYSVYGPSELTIADFNNDGNKDLAIINKPLNVFSVHLGNGTGGFTFANSYNLNNASYGLTQSDFNNDGNKDLAVCSNSSINIFRGYGNGTFSLVTTISTTVINLESTDINNDNKSDLIAIDPTHSMLKIIKASNNFSFFPIQTYTMTGGANIWSFSYADFNYDNQKDLVAIDANVSGSVFVNNGSGNFPTQSAFSYTPYGFPTSRVFASKMNADNKPDLFITSDNSSQLSVLLNCNITDLHENISSNVGLKLYPNPTSNMIYLDTEAFPEYTNGQILSNTGQVFLEFSLDKNNKKILLDLHEIPSGFYLVKLTQSSTQTVTKRLIISR